MADFAKKSGLDWLQMANFGHFAGLSIFSPKMRLRLTWNGQFHPIHNFSHLFPPKHLIFGEISKFSFLGGTSANFLSFSNFSNCFTPKWLKMTHNGQFCQKSGLDWLQMASFGHFAGFSIFSLKIRLRLTQNGQFHPIHNFSHLLPPKHLIFGEISKFLFKGGDTSKSIYLPSTFSIFGGGTFDVNLTSFNVFNLEGGTSSGRSEKCKVYG